MLQTAQEQVAHTFIPQVSTKDLALSRTPEGKRRLRLSTNLLPLYGFRKGVRYDFRPLPSGGFEAVHNEEGRYDVYVRRYGVRKNNPLETQLDIKSQSLLDACIPPYTERVHIEMRARRLVFRPLPNRTFSIRRSFDGYRGKPAAFVAMTSGIDARCLAEVGYEIDALLEFRPQEKRDKTNLTETGALCALSNVAPRVLINEDIMTCDFDRVKELMKDGPPLALLHMSPQCDDFSALKSKSLKSAHISSLDTSFDMAWDCLALTRAIQPASLIIENVPGFATHPIGQMMKVKLQRWGYNVCDGVLDARDFGGLTPRPRYYLMASVWAGLTMPAPTGRRTSPLWSEIEPFLPECRDVTATATVRAGLETGRIRLIRRDSVHAPSLVKSLSHMPKDGIYIEHEGRYLCPSNSLLAHLCGIKDFDFSAVSHTIETEILGQGIEHPIHRAVALQMLEHLHANTGARTVVSVKRAKPPRAAARAAAPRQNDLFSDLL